MSRPGPLLALVGVTAIWGVTFVQVQDALALYPLFAFLSVRFAISTVALAPIALGSLRTLPRGGSSRESASVRSWRPRTASRRPGSS